MITFLTTNWVQIVSATTAVIIAARLVVKLTPTPKDDSTLEAIISVLKHVGLHIDDQK